MNNTKRRVAFSADSLSKRDFYPTPSPPSHPPTVIPATLASTTQGSPRRSGRRSTSQTRVVRKGRSSRGNSKSTHTPTPALAKLASASADT